MTPRTDESWSADVPNPFELKDFNRTLAEIEWLLLVLILVYLALPNGDIEQPQHILVACALFAGFTLTFRYLNLFRMPARWKFTIETWAMIGLTAVAVWDTGKVDSPLIGLFLLVIIFSALTLGKLTTLLEVALITSFYLFAAYSTFGQEIYAPLIFSRLMLNFSPFVLVAYVTSLLAADLGFTRAFVQRLAETDELTGLPNMRAFRLALAHQKRKATVNGQPFTLLMVDIDKLKTVNDRFGHPTGNRVIRAVANDIIRGLRSADLVARYGGDEFIALLPRTAEQQARQAGERILSRFDRIRINTDSEPIRVRASIGFATYPSMANEIDDLIEHADKALYGSKRAGGSRVSGYHELKLSLPDVAAAAAVVEA